MKKSTDRINENKRKLIVVMAVVLMMVMCACAGSGSSEAKEEPEEAQSLIAHYDPDYMVLVNFENPLPEDWLDRVILRTTINSVGDNVFAEAGAYEAYLRMKDELEKEGIHTELDSAYRSTAEQQKIVDDFTEKYGADYVKKYVAVPGYSEHHTGLALDLYLIVDGKTVYENEDLVQYPEIWAKIHEKLPDYGFILRYPEGKEKITGANYEPWHIRYVGSPEIAREITDKGITFEEYLAGTNTEDAEADEAA